MKKKLVVLFASIAMALGLTINAQAQTVDQQAVLETGYQEFYCVKASVPKVYPGTASTPQYILLQDTPGVVVDLPVTQGSFVVRWKTVYSNVGQHRTAANGVELMSYYTQIKAVDCYSHER